MNFSDIFKSSFLENVSAISTFDMILTVFLSFGVGLFIHLIYKKTYQGVMYSTGFGVTLVALTMITSSLILAVTSNVVLSLGMVGALSIVRFRTAIKEPLDIAFLFWSVAAGIILASGMIPLAVISSVLIGLILLIFVNKKSHTHPYIAVITCSSHESETKVLEFLSSCVRRINTKSKTASRNGIEVQYEVRLKDGNTDFINILSEIEGVESAVLVSYNGDYMG